MEEYNLDKLIKLQAYLGENGFHKEAGIVGDLIDGAKGSAAKLWSRNKSNIAKATLLMAIGFAARDYIDDNSYLNSAEEAVAKVFSDLTEADYINHKVASGENLWTISQKYFPEVDGDTGINIILDENDIDNPNSIFPGQILRIPSTDALRRTIDSGGDDNHEEGSEPDIDTDGRTAFPSLSFSERGVERLKAAEGDHRDGSFKSRLYKDGVGKFTIGWGHNASAHGDVSKFKGRTIDLAEAEALLASDVANAEAGVDKWLSKKAPDAKLTGAEYDMLVELAFNGGYGSNSIVKKVIYSSKIDDGDYASLSAAVGGFGDPSGRNAGLHARRISTMINARGGDMTKGDVSRLVEEFGWKISKDHKTKSIKLRKAVAADPSVKDKASLSELLEDL